MNEQILTRLERIEERLEALERRAPPVLRTAVPPVYPPPSGEAPPTTPREPIYYAPTPPKPTSSDDLETLIGSRWLPRAGALAIIAALAFLVAIGVQSGIITPAMVVVGIAIACFGVMGLGFRFKDDREAFGHVLVGLGVGGLYVDSVGAHFYQNQLSGEAMVLCCLAISLASLGYGYWRALPSFLGIGLAGGLVGALMPLDNGDTVTSAGLLLLVAIPAFGTAGVRRWPAAVMATWFACTVASLPILAGKDAMTVRLLPLDAMLLIALAAWAVAAERFDATDPKGAFPFAAVTISGLTALLVLDGQNGALHLFLLGLAIAAGACPFASRPAASQVRSAGLVLLAALAPLSIPNHGPDAVLAALALAGAAAARRAKGLLPLVILQAVLAMGMYAFRISTVDLAVIDESGLLLLLAASSVAAAYVIEKREARVVAGLVVWGLVTRLACIGLDLPDNASITIAWIAVCAGLFVVGFLRKRPELRQLGLFVAFATVGKVVLFDLAGVDSALKAIMLLGLGLVLLAGGYAYVRAKGNLPA